MAKATDLGVDLMWLQRLCLQNGICTAPSWGRGGSLLVVRGAGFGVLGFSGEEEPWPGGIRPQGDAWEIPGGVLRPWGQLGHVVVMVMCW